MKAADIPEKVPHSQARKLVDEQLSSTVKVIHATPFSSPPWCKLRHMCGGGGKWWVGLTESPLQLPDPPQDPAIRQFLLTNLVEVDGRFSWRVNLDTLAQHLDKILTFPQQLESYSGPTLFLIGGNSRYVQ
ncbi:Protein ABHD11 [Lemmus lemmus]